MLLIIELLFLVGGLWAIVLGKLPAGLFRILFGRGEYELPVTQARLFGAFIASPLPLAFLVSFVLTVLLGSKGANLGIGFEIVYILAVIITSIVVARKAKRLETPLASQTMPAEIKPATKRSSYGLRLLVIVGVAILSCITAVSFFSLVMVTFSALAVGSRLTGDFWQDEFPFILMIAITGFGSFAIYKLIQFLRR